MKKNKKLLWIPAVALVTLALFLFFEFFYRPPIQLVQVTVTPGASSLPISSVPEETSVVPDGERLELNRATEKELDQLPGIGEALAQRIIAYRTENGGFWDVDELRQVNGIGDKLLEKLKPYVFVEREEAYHRTSDME